MIGTVYWMTVTGKKIFLEGGVVDLDNFRFSLYATVDSIPAFAELLLATQSGNAV